MARVDAEMIISGQWKIGVCVREQSLSASARRVIDWRVRLINIISKFFCLSVEKLVVTKKPNRKTSALNSNRRFSSY